MQLCYALGCLAVLSLAATSAQSETLNKDTPFDRSQRANQESAFDQPCPRSLPGGPLQLVDAIDRGLCSSPKTRGAWAGVKAAMAAVQVSKAAYLPTLDASIQVTSERVSTSVRDSPTLNSSFTDRAYQGVLTLEWLLFDFGARSAQLTNSRRLLDAARAAQLEALQEALALIVRDYRSAELAGAKLESAQRLEAAAGRTLEAATARVSRGVSAITDQYQADSALMQARYLRVKAEGESRIALGVLNIDMDEPASSMTSVAAGGTELPSDDLLDRSVNSLIEVAVASHPSVVQAEAKWQASLASAKQARATGLPTLAVVGQFSYSTQPVSASLGQEEQPATSRDRYIGLKIAIPLSDQVARASRAKEADAEAEADEQNLRDIRRKVSGGVWSSYQTLAASVQNQRSSDSLLQSAQRAFAAVEERYLRGVGNILEVLSAQSALINAEQERLESRFDVENARLQLAQSIGRLDRFEFRQAP